MQLGMIGLGKMGANMTTRLLKGGHSVVVYDRSEEAMAKAADEGATAVGSLEELVNALESPKAVWSMVPSGEPTEGTVDALTAMMESGSVIVDGGNSNYKDSMRRAKLAQERDVFYIDAGVSGGIWGLAEGYSMMVGGETEAVERLRPIFETLAPGADQGWGHVGPSGAGHFVKMVHNGIEYGLMQAYGEGFELMSRKAELGLDLHQIAEIWRYGSVVRSWLLDLTAAALDENPSLDGIAAYITDSGEGRWTVMEAIDLSCSIPVITLALQRRFRSREEDPFGDKLVAAMRKQFGGHDVKASD